ncbi:MAG: TonB-dependent receptor, partial [Bacteroidota bacterium]
MNLRRRIFLVLSIYPYLLIGQYTVSGTIMDDRGASIPFANVLLTSEVDTAQVAGTITNEDGTFRIGELVAGNYQLQLSYLGFEQQVLTVRIADNTNIGTIKLKELTTALNGVEVTATRQLVRREVDRLVFDVANSPRADGGDALSVLEASPGVSVRNNLVSMVGKRSVGVLINGKRVNIPPEELAEFLRSIASEDIEAIAVITTPPARYEAEGNSGLIDIQLKRGKANAWKTQVRASYLQRTYGSISGGTNLSYRKDKISFIGSLFVREGVFYQEQDDYAHFPDGLWYTYSPFRADITGFNGRADLQYQLNEAWSVGAQYLRNRTNYFITDAPYTPVFAEDGSISRSLQSEGEAALTPTVDAVNLNSDWQLGNDGKKLSLNLDYFYYLNPDTKQYSGVSTFTAPATTQFYRGTNTNLQDVTNLSVTLDLELPTDWAKITTGIKVTRSVSDNAIVFFNSGLTDTPVSDFETADNDFTYEEDLGAVYLSASKSLNEKWEAKLGVRGEMVQTNALSQNLELNRPFDYFKLFPTVYLTYSPTDTRTLSFSYSRRIERPNF